MGSSAPQVLFVASEVVPFAKTGGLADVAGSLPPVLRELGLDVRVIMPRYRCVDPHRFGLKRIREDLAIKLGDRIVNVAVWEGRLGDTVPAYFVDYPPYYEREHLYQTPQGDYPDNAERFFFFSRALLEVARAIGFQPDILHANDWQTALAPVYLKTLYREDPFFQNTASVFTVHNLGYQGMFEHADMLHTGLGWELFTPEGLEFYGKLNTLKGGLLFADAITTVSPTYAREILTPEHGMGLEGVLSKRASDLTGILNGLDTTVWDPAQDPHLAEPYSLDAMQGKRINKRALQMECRLPEQEKAPLLGMVTRLTDQKGLDLLVGILDELMEHDVQLVILGTGDTRYHEFLRGAEAAHTHKIAVAMRFDEALAHRIYAGCDLFLMPSRYEPCGLGQMISLRYGTIPVARQVGGLADTITEYSFSTGEGTGFLFKNREPMAFLIAVLKALTAFQEPEVWDPLVRNAMSQDFSWAHTANQYVALYQKTLERVGVP